MAEMSMAEFYKKALEEAGSGPGVIVPDGPYRVELEVIKKGASKGNAAAGKAGGKFQVGLKWKVLEGPYAGQSTWTNQTLTMENLQALGIYLRLVIQLGVDEAFVRSGQVAPDALYDYVVKGTTGVANFGSHTFNDKAIQDLKSFQVESIPTQALTPGGTPNVAAIPGPVAAPVASVAPVAPVIYPVPPVQPVAPVVPVPPVASVVYTPPVQVQPVPVVQVPPLPAPSAPAAPIAPVGGRVSF